MLAFSFLSLKQPEGTLQWIASTIPKYHSMISNSSFGSRASGRKVPGEFHHTFVLRHVEQQITRAM
jgi:hypothetical protein